MTIEATSAAATSSAPARRSVKRAALGRLQVWVSRALYFGPGGWLTAGKIPFRIEHRPDFHAHSDMPDYKALRQAWLHGNHANNGGDFSRFYALYQNIDKVLSENVPGDLVELGVYKGNSAFMIATLGRRYGRNTYLFDTFNGFDPRDLHGIDQAHQVQFKDTSLEGVKALVGEDAVTYVQGFFPASLSKIEPPAQVAVVHIDCDLHDPMRDALEFFYPRVAPGGLFILHDYSSGRWPGGAKAIDDFFSAKPERLTLIPDKSGTAIARKI